MTITVLGTQCYAYNCITCGVAFTVPVAVADQQQKKGGYHTCPNGHSQGWNKADTEEEKTRRERDRLKQENSRLQDFLAASDRAAEKARHELASHKRRAKAGVCPCCQRTVSQMARHMKTQHPDYNVVPLRASK